MKLVFIIVREVQDTHEVQICQICRSITHKNNLQTTNYLKQTASINLTQPLQKQKKRKETLKLTSTLYVEFPKLSDDTLQIVWKVVHSFQIIF